MKKYRERSPEVWAAQIAEKWFALADRDDPPTVRGMTVHVSTTRGVLELRSDEGIVASGRVGDYLTYNGGEYAVRAAADFEARFELIPDKSDVELLAERFDNFKTAAADEIDQLKTAGIALRARVENLESDSESPA